MFVAVILLIATYFGYKCCKKNEDENQDVVDDNDNYQTIAIDKENDEDELSSNAGNDSNMHSRKSIEYYSSSHQEQECLISNESSHDDEEEEIQEMLELELKTKSDDIEEYHEELLKKMMDVPGFRDIMSEYQPKIKSEKKGKMKFLLELSADIAMDNPIIVKILALLQKEERVKKIVFNQTLIKKVKEEYVQLAFVTNATDQSIEVYNKKMMKKIMKIRGFKGMIHKKSTEIISEKKGKMIFVLKESADTAMDNPIIKSVLELLDNENVEIEIESDEGNAPLLNAEIGSDVQNQRDVDEEEDDEQKESVTKHQEMMNLTFETKGKVIHVYHEELLRKILDASGFYELMYDYNIEVISDKKGKMKLTLKHSVDTAMDHPAIKKVLNILKNEERVKNVNVDEGEALAISKKDINEHTKLSEAIIISFDVKHENIKDYIIEFMKELENFDYFQYNMWEKVITVKTGKKAKFQFIMNHPGKFKDGHDDPELMAAMDILREYKVVKKLKVETIPYFVH